MGTGDLSDQIGRKIPIVLGFVLLGAGFIALTAMSGRVAWELMAVVSDVGMALLYPNSAVSDVAPVDRRGSVLGV